MTQFFPAEPNTKYRLNTAFGAQRQEGEPDHAARPLHQELDTTWAKRIVGGLERCGKKQSSVASALRPPRAEARLSGARKCESGQSSTAVWSAATNKKDQHVRFGCADLFLLSLRSRPLKGLNSFGVYLRLLMHAARRPRGPRGDIQPHLSRNADFSCASKHARSSARPMHSLWQAERNKSPQRQRLPRSGILSL
jgi:hypothetical protein